MDDNIAGKKRTVDEAEVEFDETGNWTLELARSRLSEFFQKQGKQLNCEENEFGGKINLIFFTLAEHFIRQVLLTSNFIAPAKSLLMEQNSKQKRKGRVKNFLSLKIRRYMWSIFLLKKAMNKKSAQKKCALDMVIQLYKAGRIPGNAGKRSKDGTVKRQKKDARMGVIESGMKRGLIFQN